MSKKGKVERVFWLSIVMIVGLLLVLYSIHTLHKYNTYEAVKASVTWCTANYDSDHHIKDYSINVVYSVDGVEYNDHFSHSRSYDEGRSITVLYNPDKPSDMVFQDTGGTFFIMGIGILLAAAAIFGIINPQKIYTEEDARRVREEQYNKWLNKQ